MNYKIWNEFLFFLFFNPEQKGKYVLVDITEQDILAAYLKCSFNVANPPAEQAEKEFIKVVNSGPLIVHAKDTQIEKKDISGVIWKIKEIYHIYCQYQNKGSYKVLLDSAIPPLFLYACALVYAAKKSPGNRFYEGFKKTFILGNGVSDEDIRKAITLIWNNVEDSLKPSKREIGLFYNKKDSPGNRKFVDKVLSQFIVPRTELKKLPQLFWELDLLKTDAENLRLTELFITGSRKNFIQRFIPETYKKLTNNSGDDKFLVEEIIRSQLKVFEGYAEIEQEESTTIKVQSSLQRLRLVYTEDGYTGKYKFHYRFYSDLLLVDKITFGNQEVTIGITNWSSEINRNDDELFFKPFKVLDQVLGFKAIFKSDPDSVYLFEQGLKRRLPSQVYIEADCISHVGQQVLIFTDELFSVLEHWIISNKGERLEEVLPASWIAYRFNGFSSSLPKFKKLALPFSRTTSIIKGLKGKGQGAYLSDFPIEMALEGAVGDETMLIGTLEPIKLNLITQSFKLGHLDAIGEYTYSIKSVSNNEPINLWNNGKLVIEDIKGRNDGVSQGAANNTCDQFFQIKEFSRFRNLLTNMPGLDKKPPQLELWKVSKVDDFQNDFYENLGIRFIAYLAYFGRQSRQTFERNLIAFYDSLSSHLQTIDSYSTNGSNFSLITYDKFKKYTLNILIESSRIKVHFDDYSVTEIFPIRPFIARVINATNFTIDQGDFTLAGAKPFSGELYYIGGCYNESHIFQIQKKTKQPQYKGGVSIALFSEATNTSLIPLSAFIYITANTGFIKEVQKILNSDEVYNYFELFPNVPIIIDVLEKIRKSRGRHCNFHSSERAMVFNSESYRFETPIDSSLPIPSLTKYVISPFEQLVIIRVGELEAETDLRWGRYLYLYLINKTQRIIYFDPNRNILAIPARLPFPREIEQTMYFSTGRLPLRKQMFVDGSGLKESEYGKLYLLYQGIFENIARQIIKGIGQTLTTSKIITNRK